MPKTLFIRIKAAGKRRDMLEKRPETIPDEVGSAETLIEHLVRKNVRAYNDRMPDVPWFHYLSQDALSDGAYRGKIAFGDRKNPNPQNEDEAVKNALQCFSDGIFRLLVNDIEITPGGAFSLAEGDTITFIRLVMLAGGWF